MLSRSRYGALFLPFLYESNNVTSFHPGIDHIPTCGDLEGHPDGIEVDPGYVKTPPGVCTEPVFQRGSG